MLLNVEDLAHERNGRAGGNGADGVQGGGEAAEALARPGSGQVEDGHHGDDQHIARAGANLVPMGRDKQHHAAGQQNGPENQRHHALPTQTSGALLLQLKGANAGSSLRIQDAGRLPAV